jgi:ABC-type transporter Mla subunit MlaD
MRQLLEIGNEPSQVVADTNAKEPELIQTIMQQLNKLSQQIAALNTKVDLVSESVKQLQTSQNQQKLSDDVIKQIITTVKQVVEETRTKIPEPSPKATHRVDNERKDYNEMTVTELKSIASKRKIKGCSKMKKQDLITELTKSD